MGCVAEIELHAGRPRRAAPTVRTTTSIRLNQSGLPESRRPQILSQRKSSLVFIVTEQSALLQILAANAVSRPRHRVETFLRQCFTAVNTLPITRCFDSFERLIDQVQ